VSTRHGKTKRQRQTRKIEEEIPTAPAPAPAPADTFTPFAESHSFMSSMTFDGNTLTTKTQKDDGPVIQRKYTRKQLAREIPIGKEMIDTYLDGKIPEELHRHHHNHNHNHHHNHRHMHHDGHHTMKTPLFRNVLISPADLGLLPPDNTAQKTQHRRTRRQQRRFSDRDNDELQLIVEDNDPASKQTDDHDRYKRRTPRNLFDLP
jgi:hypothetical protein